MFSYSWSRIIYRNMWNIFRLNNISHFLYCFLKKRIMRTSKNNNIRTLVYKRFYTLPYNFLRMLT